MSSRAKSAIHRSGQSRRYSRIADLLFELINCRHEKKSTLISTNKAFSEWSEVFKG